MRSELVAMMIGALFLGITACSTAPTPLDQHWGEAARTNAQSMVVNPEGTSENSDPGAVSDGITTENNMARLRAAQSPKSKSSAAPIFNIGNLSGGK